jgi:hypothetical protein
MTGFDLSLYSEISILILEWIIVKYYCPNGLPSIIYFSGDFKARDE